MRIEIEALNKSYRDVRAVRDFSLQLGPGILGLLGPNGAGKSTLMRLLATVTRPTSGTIRFDGADVVAAPNKVRRVLGYLPQDFGVYPHLSATEFLEYIGALKGIPRRVLRARIGELLEVLNLSHAASRPLGGFSGGMRQRVGIAQALLNEPELLIVDEPTAGLDPQERVKLRALLRETANDRIVIFSTHICSDVETVADRIAIVDHGSLLAYDAPSRMLRPSESLENCYLRVIAEIRAAA